MFVSYQFQCVVPGAQHNSTNRNLRPMKAFIDNDVFTVDP